MVITEGVDAAGMSFSAHIEDFLHHGQRILKLALILEEGKQCGKFFTGEEEFLTDLIDSAACYRDELSVLRDLKSGCESQLLRADGNGIRESVACLIPHDLL